MAESDETKIHPPTPRRRKQARDEGRVARSNEFVSAMALLAATGGLWMWGDSAARRLSMVIQDGLSDSSTSAFSLHDATHLLLQAALVLGQLVLPIMVFLFTVGVAANVLQTGPIISPNRVAPSLERINAAQGAGRVFCRRNIAMLGFSIFKICVLAGVMGWLVRTRGEAVLRLGELSAGDMARAMFNLLHSGCFWIALSLVTLSGIDYAIAWWNHEQSLKMTEQELREELRDTEGNRQTIKHPRTQPVSPA